jgi:ATP phosphoribosyltransferase regulatory subunit
MPAWLLPESISDILPAEARRIEELRRTLLDLFRTYGYELVMPPLLEYTESLLSGTGRDMDLQMFKLIDQISGRTMGLRADITPQVARIDAHLLNRMGVTRLCYAGSVVHTRPQALSSTREPLQVGAEIYGHAGPEADLEVQELLLAALARVGLREVRLDLGHAEVLRAILAGDPAGFVVAEEVYACLQAKDREGLALLSGLASTTSRALIELCELYGGVEVISRARASLPGLPRIARALDELEQLVADLNIAEVTIDLADIRGYYYHTGVMFSAYCPGLPSAIARGGRYDQVGETFGRARPAAGFSLYLRDLAPLLGQTAVPSAIRAPWSNDQALRSLVAQLRAEGEIVIQALPGHEHELEEFHCDRVLLRRGSNWVIEPFSGAALA